MKNTGENQDSSSTKTYETKKFCRKEFSILEKSERCKYREPSNWANYNGTFTKNLEQEMARLLDRKARPYTNLKKT